MHRAILKNDVVIYPDDLVDGKATSNELNELIMSEFREYVTDNGYTYDDISMNGRVYCGKPAAFLNVWLHNEKSFQVYSKGHMKRFTLRKRAYKSLCERVKLYDSILKWIVKK